MFQYQKVYFSSKMFFVTSNHGRLKHSFENFEHFFNWIFIDEKFDSYYFQLQLSS